MKILIGYNGSQAAEAAIDDLVVAGLPPKTEITVLAIAESWLPPLNIDEARKLAELGSQRILKRHPTFTVKAEVASGSPANEILAFSNRFQPDLIIIGEPNERNNGRSLFLGHTSQRIVTESVRSVRIARGLHADTGHIPRLLIGFDGSPTALKAVRTIAESTWPERTTVRLLAVADSSVLSSIGRFTPEMTSVAVGERLAGQWAATLANEPLQMLRDAGLTSELQVQFGNPKYELGKHAGEWGADAIYVGPHCAPDSFERFIFGSVAAAVAANANCTVEIVRS